MKIAGIIAEYDPFHAGHALQLAQLRQMGAETIVVCMSGDTVQRGSFAVLPPAVRVRAALQNGADLVIALPNPYAGLSAEGFAAAGVQLLGAMGCVDTVAFGAETPDAPAMMQLAELLDSPQFAAALQTQLAAGLAFAPARAAAVASVSPALGVLLQTPNNILGVEYCKALRRQESTMQPLPLLRRGAGHGSAHPSDAAESEENAVPDPNLSAPATASGSFLRGVLAAEGAAAMRRWLPESAATLYEEAEAAGLCTDARAVDLCLLARLRSKSAAELATVRGMGEGLENRLSAALRRAGSMTELYDALKTKRYAHARLRRLCMDAALEIEEGMLPEFPPFLWVLGAKKSALPLCKNALLPCGTSLAALSKTNEACAAVAAAHVRAADLAALCRKTPGPMGLSFTQKPIIVE